MSSTQKYENFSVTNVQVYCTKICKKKLPTAILVLSDVFSGKHKTKDLIRTIRKENAQIYEEKISQIGRFTSEITVVCFQRIKQTQHSITYLSPLIIDHFRRIKYENSEQGKSVDFIKRGGGGKIVLEENRGCILKTQNALAMTS